MDPGHSDGSSGRVPADRLASWLLGAYLLFAYVLLVFWAGRDDWFTFGDWHLLAGPVTQNIWAPIEQHWSTLPALLYWGFFQIFGLEYFPFLATVVALHIVIVVLVWRIMVRARIRPWLAGLAATPLVLFGPGYISIIFPIQTAQNLSLVFGLSQLLLADHHGKISRRDWVGLGAGAAGLMSSGIMPLLVFATGLTTLVRRGWRAAAFHTAPLAAMYLAWFWIADPLQQDRWYKARVYDPAAHWDFIASGLTGSLRALAGSGWVAAFLAAFVTTGLVLRLSRENVRPRAKAIAAQLALLISAPLYLAVVGYQRSRSGPAYAELSHHLYNTLVFTIPVLGVATDEFVRRWRWTALVVGAFVATSVYVNAEFEPASRRIDLRPRTLKRMEYLVKELAASPELDRVVAESPDRILILDRRYTRNLTPRWLAENRDAGRIPRPPSQTGVSQEEISLILRRSPEAALRPRTYR